jgi:glycosyltransferase involved in cell wall biosynthesis
VNEIIKKNYNGHKIKYFSHQKNLGMMPNFLFTIEHCTGKYIALCEGDDYWTDPLKLQKQVDFLEKNDDFSICFHNVYLQENDKLIPDNLKRKIPTVTTIYDLAKNNYIHTPSVIYRNGLTPVFPDYFKVAPIGDYFLHLLNAKYGKIKYIDQIMASYRIHSTSYWSSKKSEEQKIIIHDFINNIKENFDIDVQILLDNQIKKIETKRKNLFYKIKSFLFTNNH